MQYFELFNLPVGFVVSKEELRRRYLQLSRQHHPDYFASGDAAQQEEAMDKTALLNKALQTLSQRDQTIQYILKEKGLLEEEEKYSLPPDFLMEMMELNEAAESGSGEGTEELVQEKEKEIYGSVQAIIENYKEGTTTEADLLQVKDYYFRKKYLDRLRQQLG